MGDESLQGIEHLLQIGANMPEKCYPCTRTNLLPMYLDYTLDTSKLMAMRAFIWRRQDELVDLICRLVEIESPSGRRSRQSGSRRSAGGRCTYNPVRRFD